MALTRPKETPEFQFVEAALDFLFDFSDPSKFAETEEQIILAYQGKLKSDHPLYSLQNTFKQPRRYLQRLDELGKFTEGNIKETLIHLATKKIIEGAANAIPPADNIKWNPQSLLNDLPKDPNYKKLFKPERIVVAHNLNQEVKQIASQKIFTTQLLTENDEDESGDEIFTFSAEIITSFPDEENEIVELDRPFHRNAFDDEEEKKESLQELAPIADLLAIEHASEIALKNLVAQNIISEADAKTITDAGRRVLTCQYYFDSISQNQIQFNDIARINYTESSALESVIVIDLLKENICTLAQAKKIRVKILETPFYYRKISSKEFPLELFLDLSDEAVKNLISSNIMYLIDQNKLKIELAKMLSTQARTLLEDENRFVQFKKGEISEDFLVSMSYLTTQRESKPTELSRESKARHIAIIPQMERIRLYCEDTWLGLLKLNPRQKFSPPIDQSDIMHISKWYFIQTRVRLRYYRETVSTIVFEQIKPNLIRQFLTAIGVGIADCKDSRSKKLSVLEKKILNAIRTAKAVKIAAEKPWEVALFEIYKFTKETTKDQSKRCCRFFSSSNHFLKQFCAELSGYIDEFMKQLELKKSMGSNARSRLK